LYLLKIEKFIIPINPGSNYSAKIRPPDRTASFFFLLDANPAKLSLHIFF